MFHAVLGALAALCNFGILLLTTAGKSGDAVLAVLAAVAMIAFAAAAITYWREYTKRWVDYEVAERSQQKEE